MNKKELRNSIQEIRDNIPAKDKAVLDRAILDNFLAWKIYANAQVIFCFVSFRSEVDTFQLIEKSIELGKVVAVPKINLATKQMKAYVIDSIRYRLKPGEYGILEPDSSCIELDYSDLQLIVTPGLAFTLRGDRLGYGGGFYDRFIEKHDHSVVCAPTYDRLLLAEIPVKVHDLPVDYVITESGVKSSTRS